MAVRTMEFNAKLNAEFSKYETATEMKLGSPTHASEKASLVSKMRYWWQFASNHLELIVDADSGKFTVLLDGALKESQESPTSLFEFQWRGVAGAQKVEIVGKVDKFLVFVDDKPFDDLDRLGVNHGRTMVLENTHKTLEVPSPAQKAKGQSSPRASEEGSYFEPATRKQSHFEDDPMM